MQPLQGGRLLHHRPRCGHRQGTVAHVDHRPAGRARRRHLGRPAAQVPGRQRRVDPRQLRSGRQPRLLGHGAGEAVGASGPRHRRVRALHELDARARSRHREDEVVLPAPSRRNAGHGRSVREHPDRRRRTQVAVQDGQARHSLAARSSDRRVHPRDGSRIPDDPRRESGDRQGRRTAPGKIPQIGVAGRHVSEHGRLQELARHGVQPADQRVVHPDEPELREGDLRPRSGEGSRAAAAPVRCSARTTSIRRPAATSANSRRST